MLPVLTFRKVQKGTVAARHLLGRASRETSEHSPFLPRHGFQLFRLKTLPVVDNPGVSFWVDTHQQSSQENDIYPIVKAHLLTVRNQHAKQGFLVALR